MDFSVLSNKMKIVVVKFDDGSAARMAMRNNRLDLGNHWVLVETFQASFSIKKKAATKHEAYPVSTEIDMTLHSSYRSGTNFKQWSYKC